MNYLSLIKEDGCVNLARTGMIPQIMLAEVSNIPEALKLRLYIRILKTWSPSRCLVGFRSWRWIFSDGSCHCLTWSDPCLLLSLLLMALPHTVPHPDNLPSPSSHLSCCFLPQPAVDCSCWRSSWSALLTLLCPSHPQPTHLSLVGLSSSTNLFYEAFPSAPGWSNQPLFHTSLSLEQISGHS